MNSMKTLIGGVVMAVGTIGATVSPGAITGVAGTFVPVQVFGAGSVTAAEGQSVTTTACGTGLCFLAEGGGTYAVQP